MKQTPEEAVKKEAMQQAVKYKNTYPDANTFDFRVGFENGFEWALSQQSPLKGIEELRENIYDSIHDAVDGGFDREEFLKIWNGIILPYIKNK